MSYEDKPVEDWSPRDYDDFWSNYIRIVRVTKCKICGDKLEGRDITGHMERKHAEKYEEHNEQFDLEDDGEVSENQKCLDSIEEENR